MTVRTWFRLQRGVLWARDDSFSSGIECIAAAAVDRTPLPSRVRVGDIWIVFDLAAYESAERLCASINAEIRRISLVPDWAR